MNDRPLRRAATLAASAALYVALAAAASRAQTHAVGLGKILATADGGQIFGFALDQHGNDGVLASARTISKNGDMLVSVETFDPETGRIVRSFARARGKRDSYSVDGIFAGDAGLVTHYVTPKGSIYANRLYDVMAPVTSNAFTKPWIPPVSDIDVLQSADDQTTPESVLFAIELKNQDRPDLVVADVRAARTQKLIHLDPSLFGGANGPRLAEYTAAGKAVIALSPDAGTVGGAPPLNVLVDLKTGKSTQFDGFNNGPFHAGYVNGLAVDPNTGVAATDTELNAQVELYDLNRQTPLVALQLPCSGPGDQSLSGAGITVDAIHHLFLVTEPAYCNGTQGSALVVYDETGTLVETIAGFAFALAEPPVAIDPAKRMGWAFGPTFSQLQQFFY